MSLTLTRVPAFSAGMPHAHAAWTARGGYLVVPRREAATAALLAELREDGAPFGREAVTFAGLRHRVAEAAGTREIETPSRVELRFALREVLDRVDLSAFGASAQAPGFLSGIERALGELRGARVPPARVKLAAPTPIARALAEVYAAACEAVRFPSDAAWAIADAAAGLTAFPAVTVAGFDDVAPADWALLRALGQVTDIEFVAPFDPVRAAFEARRDRQARWADGAATMAIDIPPGDGPPTLARGLFDDGPPTGPFDGVRLVGAAGTRGMLRAALDEVLDAAAQGVALSRIALVVPRLADLRDDIERLLADWDVPARLTSRERVLDAPLALALTHLLHLGELGPDGPGALDHLLGWLRTPYSGADPDDVDGFEVDARRGNLVGRGELMSRWEGPAITPARRLVAAANAGPRAQLAALVEHGWSALRRATASHTVPTPADLRDRAALMALSGLARAFADDIEDGAADEAAAGRPRGPLPPGVLGEIIADLTTVGRVGAPGGLHVHDFASIRGSDHDVVVIVGVDGDGYPTRSAADPFLADLRAPLADVLPSRAPGTSESRLRFVHAVDAARTRVVFVRRLVDDDGREVAPSPYWIEVARVAGLPHERLDRRTGARGEVAEGADAARTEREALRAIALDGGVTPGLLAQALGRRTRRFGVPDDAFHDRRRFHVTEIETYLRCPYGWFHGAVLSPQPIELVFDPALEGTVGHAVLHRVYTRLHAENGGPCDTGSLARYRAVLEEVLPDVAAELRPPAAGAAYDALVERLRRHLSAMLGREADLQSAMVPSLFEQRMDDRVMLEVVAPGLVMSGRVDRLDLTDDLALVIDYKRSGGDFNAKSDEVAKRLQLPLYGVMARNTLDIPVEPIGGLYLGMLRPSTKGAVRDDVPGVPRVLPNSQVSAERWDQIVEEAVGAARDAVRRIRRGEIAPPTTHATCPPWCRCGDLWR